MVNGAYALLLLSKQLQNHGWVLSSDCIRNLWTGLALYNRYITDHVLAPCPRKARPVTRSTASHPPGRESCRLASNSTHRITSSVGVLCCLQRSVCFTFVPPPEDPAALEPRTPLRRSVYVSSGLKTAPKILSVLLPH